jgi:hypothetical protein
MIGAVGQQFDTWVDAAVSGDPDTDSSLLAAHWRKPSRPVRWSTQAHYEPAYDFAPAQGSCPSGGYVTKVVVGHQVQWHLTLSLCVYNGWDVRHEVA